MPKIRMIAIAALLAIYGVPGPAGADDAADQGLPERIERALRDMMQGMQPTLDQALDYLQSLGAVDDPRHYRMPEILPNGDIIIRRREDAPALGPEDPPAAPEAPAPDPEDGVRI